MHGVGSAASFHSPYGVADSHRVRKMSPTGAVTTLAGSSFHTPFADGVGSAATFADATGVALDTVGNIYVTDFGNQKIRKINSAAAVTTFAGSGFRAFADGLGTAASFDFPYGIAIDTLGNVYVTDSYNNRIRKISPAGAVMTLAGSGLVGSADGVGTVASFNGPRGVAVDKVGSYVGDYDNNGIRVVSPAGAVTTLAGSGTAAFADGFGTAASFFGPAGVALDILGNVYVADTNNYSIRKITVLSIPTGIATPASSVMSTAAPTLVPTVALTAQLTSASSSAPTAELTLTLSSTPISGSTSSPSSTTGKPTAGPAPSVAATVGPTPAPSAALRTGPLPGLSSAPTAVPTAAPSTANLSKPFTAAPTRNPSLSPTLDVTAQLSAGPTYAPHPIIVSVKPVEIDPYNLVIIGLVFANGFCASAALMCCYNHFWA